MPTKTRIRWALPTLQILNLYASTQQILSYYYALSGCIDRGDTGQKYALRLAK